MRIVQSAKDCWGVSKRDCQEIDLASLLDTYAQVTDPIDHLQVFTVLMLVLSAKAEDGEKFHWQWVIERVAAPDYYVEEGEAKEFFYVLVKDKDVGWLRFINGHCAYYCTIDYPQFAENLLPHLKRWQANPDAQIMPAE